MARERIQKILAAAGFGSRRACEDLVERGRVTVNGQVVRELPCLVDPEHDRIAIDGRPVRRERPVYYLLNKPPGVYCTHNDLAGRKRAVDLLVGVRERVYPVGRLEAESSGLLLLTNDGALTQKLTHPRFGAPKTYRAEVRGVPTPQTLERLKSGVWLSEGRSGGAAVSIVHRDRERAILEITLRESRNREIRRVLARLGHAVRRLTRIRMGKLSIRGLAVGGFRPLTKSEVAYLYRLAEGAADLPGGKAGRTTRPPPARKAARRSAYGPAKSGRNVRRHGRA